MILNLVIECHRPRTIGFQAKPINGRWWCALK